MAGFLGNQPPKVPLTSADIADGTITNDDLAGSIADGKITGLSASKLTGALPAISGASLTNLPSDITKATSDPVVTTNPSGGVGTLYLNKNSGELFCCTDSTTDNNVWTNIGSGSGDVPIQYLEATGGTVTTDGSYKVHTFTSSSNFVVSSLGTIGPNTVEYLVIAGGGGGGAVGGGYSSGGGGAGGYRTATGFAVTAQTYSITVGAGGASGVNGSDSVFSTITSTGGGKGKSQASTNADGGSGGGGTGNTTGGAGNTPSTTPSQGNNGGTGDNGGYCAGGGGGAGAVGGNSGSGSGCTAGSGGAGTASSIDGVSTTRAGGGGGGGNGTPGSGGTGGGGSGKGSGSGDAGTVNTGSGGGGTIWTGTGGGTGGSGVVILKYKYQA